MVYKRRRRNRRIVRRRLYRRRRIMRPIKGSGFNGRRFFKLRQSSRVNQAPASAGGYLITDDPSSAPDWASLAALFDSYRVCAIKMKFISDGTFQSMTDANGTGSVYHNVPVYVFHDCNSIVSTVPSEIANVVQYEKLKVKQVTRMFSYYRKMRHNVPINL
jgi:hypothetical protein